jgi:hypothetical protein
VLLEAIIQAGGAVTLSGTSSGGVDELLSLLTDRRARRNRPHCDVMLRGGNFHDDWLGEHDQLRSLPITSVVIEQTQLSAEGVCRLLEAHRIDTITAPDLPLTDVHLARAAKRATLRFLNLNRTELTDASLSQLDSSQLGALYVGGTEMTPAGLATLRNAPRLQALGIDGRQFTPEMLEMLGTLPRLSNLVLTGPAINDEHLQRVAAMPQIKLLLLEGTSVTPAAAGSFREQRSDCRLQGLPMSIVNGQ